MPEKIEFERNWSDYLTKCPYLKDIMVGSYECANKCKYCLSCKEFDKPIRNACDYGKYFDTWNGFVSCLGGQSKS